MAIHPPFIIFSLKLETRKTGGMFPRNQKVSSKHIKADHTTARRLFHPLARKYHWGVSLISWNSATGHRCDPTLQQNGTKQVSYSYTQSWHIIVMTYHDINSCRRKQLAFLVFKLMYSPPQPGTEQVSLKLLCHSSRSMPSKSMLFKTWGKLLKNPNKRLNAMMSHIKL